jgi:hypothetical protein
MSLAAIRWREFTESACAIELGWPEGDEYGYRSAQGSGRARVHVCDIRKENRPSFHLRIAGKPTAGVIKDVVMLGGFQELEFDFTADNPGMTLFHCHQQLHMDFGFMALLEYA